jgi:hypothetical protein
MRILVAFAVTFGMVAVFAIAVGNHYATEVSRVLEDVAEKIRRATK